MKLELEHKPTKKLIDPIQMKLLWAGGLLLLFMFLFQAKRVEHYGQGRYGEFAGAFVHRIAGSHTSIEEFLNAILWMFDPCNFIPKFRWLRLFRDVLCSEYAGCKEGEERFGPIPLCYKKCKPGFDSHWLAPWACYKQYPEFENNGMLHTLLDITKASKTVMGSPLNYCDKKDMDAGLCYDQCKKGTKGIGPMCWQDWYGVGIGTIP